MRALVHLRNILTFRRWTVFLGLNSRWSEPLLSGQDRANYLDLTDSSGRHPAGLERVVTSVAAWPAKKGLQISGS